MTNILKYVIANRGAMDEPFDFEKLNKTYREEKSKTELQKVDKNFYRQLSEYLGRIKKEWEETEKKAGPDDSSTVMFRDEYKKATQRAENVIDMRLKKIMDLARLEVHGVKNEIKNILPEEKVVLDRLIGVLKDWCDTNMEQRYSELKTVAPAKETEKGSSVEKKNDLQIQAREDTLLKSTAPSMVERMVVAVLADLPPFAGIDRTYLLKKGDVATLPLNIGEILCKNKKVRRIL